jgi:hypothetical protein
MRDLQDAELEHARRERELEAKGRAERPLRITRPRRMEPDEQWPAQAVAEQSGAAKPRAGGVQDAALLRAQMLRIQLRQALSVDFP